MPTFISPSSNTSRRSKRRKISVRISSEPPVISAPVESATFARRRCFLQERMKSMVMGGVLSVRCCTASAPRS